MHRSVYALRLEPVMVALVGNKIKGIAPELVDTDGAKFKYPVVDKGALAFMIFGDTGSDQGTMAVVFRLTKLHHLPRMWAQQANIEVKEKQYSKGFGRKKRETVIALLSGPTVIKALPAVGQYSLTFLDEKGRGKEVELADRPLDLHSFGSRLLTSNVNGVSQVNEAIFDCHAVWNFSIAKNNSRQFMALDFYDDENKAVVGIRDIDMLDNCSAGNSVVLPGHLPSFAPSGALLALSKLKHVSDDKVWNLSIWDLNNLRAPPSLLFNAEGVDIYDIKTDAFKYNRSFSWIAGDGYEALYYRNTSNVRSLQRVECRGIVCGEAALLNLADAFCVSRSLGDSPDFAKLKASNSREDYRALRKKWEGQLVWVPIGPCRREAGVGISRLQISAIEWMAPYVIAGAEYVAAQVVLRISPSISGKVPWVTRMMLFRVAK
jgi:hypothetical protein